MNNNINDYNNPIGFGKNLFYNNKFIDPNIPDDKILSKTEIEESVKESEYNRKHVNRFGYQSLENKTTPHKKVSVINIDSSQRSLGPVNIMGSVIYELDKNPLIFNNNQSLMKIIHKNHPFVIEDKISLSNVSSVNINFFDIISIKKNSFYVRIEHASHGISLTGLYDNTTVKDLTAVSYVDRLTSSDIFQLNGINTIFTDTKQNYILNSKIILDLSVIISGVKGNFSNINRELDNVNPNNFIFEIPVNVINKKQQIYPIIYFDINTGTYIVDENAYLILLPKAANYNYLDGSSYDYINTTYTDPVNGSTFYSSIKEIIANPIPTPHTVQDNTIQIIFLNMYNIPINYINAAYPLNTGQRKGFHIIKNVGADFYIVDLGQKAFCKNQNQFSTTRVDENDIDTIFNVGGGNFCTIRYVTDVLDGYPNPYNYKIKLTKDFKNISRVRLLSSEFPNTYRLINNSSGKIYWQNLDDGDYIYSADVISGNYSPLKLAGKIAEVMSSVLRIPYKNDTLLQSQIKNYDVDGFYKYHIFKVDIDVVTDIVLFSSYREILLKTDKVIIIPDINIIVTLESHNLTNSDIGNFYILVTPTQPSSLSINSPKTIYQLDGVNGTLSMSLNTSLIFISDIISVGTSIKYTDLQFNSDVTFGLIVAVSTGYLLKINDLIYNSTENNLYIITAVLDNNQYSIVTSPKKLIYGNSFINIIPVIGATFKFMSFSKVIDSQYKMIVNHPGNNLVIGDKITVSNSSGVNGVRPNIINGDHYIAGIIDADHYFINLTNIDTTYVSGGKNGIISIRYADLFRLRFDFSDTFGDILAFRNVGAPNAITKYGGIISNQDFYEDDKTYDSTGISIIDKKNVMHLSGPQYFLMKSAALTNIYNNGNVDNVFAKILLTDVPGTILFNTYVSPPINFDFPLSSLSVVDFSFYLPDGNIFDFNGFEHSFTLEITELINFAPDTQYNSRLNTDTNANNYNN